MEALREGLREGLRETPRDALSEGLREDTRVSLRVTLMETPRDTLSEGLREDPKDLRMTLVRQLCFVYTPSIRMWLLRWQRPRPQSKARSRKHVLSGDFLRLFNPTGSSACGAFLRRFCATLKDSRWVVNTPNRFMSVFRIHFTIRCSTFAY